MKNIKFILMDVEGTTTDINFVKNELFPFAYERLDIFIENNFDEISEKAKAYGHTMDKKLMIDMLKSWIEQDRKEPFLKYVQGKIWKAGYEQGEIKGHVYPDAVNALKDWSAQGIRLGVYSSGSVEAQKLLYKHSIAGDLDVYFCANFDLKVGKKFESQSYEKILEKLKLDYDLQAQEVLFLSDVAVELDAAQRMGINVIQVWRDFQDKGNFHIVRNFSEIDLRNIK